MNGSGSESEFFVFEWTLESERGRSASLELLISRDRTYRIPDVNPWPLEDEEKGDENDFQDAQNFYDILLRCFFNAPSEFRTFLKKKKKEIWNTKKNFEFSLFFFPSLMKNQWFLISFLIQWFFSLSDLSLYRNVFKRIERYNTFYENFLHRDG